jgi:hypothetical protein
MLSLHGLAGYKMAVSQSIYIHVSMEDQHLIDRDTLILPEIICENYPSDTNDVARVLRPAFDAVWNASGWRTSLGYDEKGEWGKGPNCQ